MEVESNNIAATVPIPSTSLGQSGRMASAPYHLIDMVMPKAGQMIRKLKEYLVVEGNASDGTPELSLQKLELIVPKNKNAAKKIDANLLKQNHVCTSKCFPTRRYSNSKKNKNGKGMLVCPRCVLECPKGNERRSCLELNSLSIESRRRLTKVLTRGCQPNCPSQGEPCIEKRMKLETFQGESEAGDDDEAASQCWVSQEEAKLWNDFFEKQAKGESSDFMEVLGAALGKKLSRGSRVPCHLCDTVLPLWLHRCHVRHYHDPIKMNVCNRCTRRYSTKVRLRRHQKKAHKCYIGKCVACRQIHFLKDMLVFKRNGKVNGKKQNKARCSVSTSTTATAQSKRINVKKINKKQTKAKRNVRTSNTVTAKKKVVNVKKNNDKKQNKTKKYNVGTSNTAADKSKDNNNNKL